MAEKTPTLNWNEFLKDSSQHRIPEKVFAFLDIETLTLGRLVSKEWKDFIDNNNKLNQKQLQLGIKLAKKKDFFGRSTFNAQQYRVIEDMLWDLTDLKIVLQVVKEVCNPPMNVSNDGFIMVSDNNPLSAWIFNQTGLDGAHDQCCSTESRSFSV